MYHGFSHEYRLASILTGYIINYANVASVPTIGGYMGYEFIESDDYDDAIEVTNINLDSDYLYQ